jgi:uncharacterized protein (TIGR01732 family)
MFPPLSISKNTCISYSIVTLNEGGAIMGYSGGFNNNFALIVVLFILLIIVGTSFGGSY